MFLGGPPVIPSPPRLGRRTTAHGLRIACTGALLWALAASAQAQSVTFNGLLGDRALLIINGQAQSLPVGASAQGVKLIRLENGLAQIEIGGRLLTAILALALAVLVERWWAYASRRRP